MLRVGRVVPSWCSVTTIQKYQTHIPDWRMLVDLDERELANFDVGAMNLACAPGLPQADRIDYSGCIVCLDRWAQGIREITRKGLEAEYPLQPSRYDHSEHLYRAVTLVLGLKHFCGVIYNPAKTGAKLTDPFDLDEQFIHGAIQGPGGTCATLPVVYAAVGRRLGYPIRLVITKGHMFSRWDDPQTGVRFNIEGTVGNGFNTHDDQYYRSWPYTITDAEEAAFGWLSSLTPRQEFACFIASRAFQWWQLGMNRRAIAAQMIAVKVEGVQGARCHQLQLMAQDWERKLVAQRPPKFPKLEITVDASRRRWPWVQWEIEKLLRYYEAAESVLRDPELNEQLWEPLRQGREIHGPMPQKLVVDCTAEELCSTHP